MTATSEIPNLPDGSVLPIFSGKIERIWDITTGQNPGKKAWKKQGWLVETPSGKVKVETFTQSLFVVEADIGKDFAWYSSKTDAGYLGITKKSYTTKPKEGDDPNTFVPEKKHSIFLGKGTRLTPPKPATPMPPPIAPPAPMEPAPTPHPKSMLPAPSNAITRLAKQWKMCFEAVRAVNPEFSITELLPPTATVFIEAQRSGVKEFAAKEPVPASGNVGPPPLAAIADATIAELEKPKPAARLTPEALATRIISDQKITADDLDGYELDKIYDLLAPEILATYDMLSVDKAYRAARAKSKERKETEREFFVGLFTHWPIFITRIEAAKAMAAAALEVEVEVDV